MPCWSASHAATFRNAKHVNAIESGDVLKALSPIWTTKSETARRLKQRIRVVVDWVKVSGYRNGDNPVDGVAKVLPKVRQAANHHAALPYGELPAFLAVLRAADVGESTKLAFEFLILNCGVHERGHRRSMGRD